MQRRVKSKDFCGKGCVVVFLALTFFISAAMAQQTVPAAGGDARGSQGSVSYSLGQTFFTTHYGTQGSVAPGVQQPYEITVITGVQEKDFDLAITVYPNPASHSLTLSTGNYQASGLSYLLYDLHGSILESSNITATLTHIEVGHLPHATYFVKILDGQKGIKTFRIVKN
jgi:hypothetical protein